MKYLQGELSSYEVKPILYKPCMKLFGKTLNNIILGNDMIIAAVIFA